MAGIVERIKAAPHVRMDHTAGGNADAWDQALADAEKNKADDQRIKQAANSGRVTLDGGGGDDAVQSEKLRVDEAVKADRERCAEIRKVCLSIGQPDKVDQYIADGVSADLVRRELWDAKASEHAKQDDKANGSIGRVEQTDTQTSEGRFARGMSDAMIERMGGHLVDQVQGYEREQSGDPSHRIDGGEFRGLSLTQMGILSLQRNDVKIPAIIAPQQAGDIIIRSCMALERDQFAAMQHDEMAMARYARELSERQGHVTFAGGSEMQGAQGRDQFPTILRDAMHRVLHSTFAGAQEAGRFVWPQVCERGSASDFRDHYHHYIGGLPDMPTKTETGEYETVQVGDAESGKIRIVERGMKIKISREALINDDLGGILKTTAQIGPVAMRTIENKLFEVLNAQSGDGDFNGAAMFTSGRGTKVTGAVSQETVHNAWVALRKLKSIGDNDYLDLMGDTVLTSLEQAAIFRVINGEKLEFSAENKGQGGPNRYDMTGQFKRILSTPRLSSSTRWYLWDSMASPWMVSFLGGRDTPYLQQMESWSMEGTCFLGAIDFGLAATTYRGAMMSTGA